MAGHCGHCGEKIDGNYAFCGSCGATINRESEDNINIEQGGGKQNIIHSASLSSKWFCYTKDQKRVIYLGAAIILVIAIGVSFWVSSRDYYVDLKTLASSINSSSPSQNQTYVGKEVETRGYLTATMSGDDFMAATVGGTGTGFINIISLTNDSNSTSIMFGTNGDTRSLRNKAVTVRCTVATISDSTYLDGDTCTVEYYGSTL